MPAENNNFPWMSYYGNYSFFEDRMISHSKVQGIRCIGDGLYRVKLNSKKTLRVFICECYSFGVAEYYETIENLGKLDAVIINSNWCGYTYDAKYHCWKNNVGLFNIVEFMAAINMKNFWDYLTKQEKKHFESNGWL